MEDQEYKQLVERYKSKIKEEFGAVPLPNAQISSREYTEFKEELYPTRYSLYEKACNFAATLNIKPDEKTQNKLNKDLATAHLNTTPAGVLGFAIIVALITILLAPVVAFILPKIFGLDPQMILVFFMLAAGGGLFFILQKVPSFMATTWRMKASNQMVQAIFYMVTYMRHTSNMERAIEFASQHLEPPLNLDFRKILWDVETQKYSTIRDSANAYLEQWQEFDKEFVEAFHLLESSLLEGNNDRRLTLLDKALEVILNGTYENMLHYAHNLKSPMTMLHMLGIILPILGLVILPLVVSFMAGDSNPFLLAFYISLMYNVGIPTVVFLIGKQILAKRPAGYGAVDISKKEGVKKLRNVNIPITKQFSIGINPLFFSIGIAIVAILIGFSPLFMHAVGTSDIFFDTAKQHSLLGYVCPPTVGQDCANADKIGPFGIGSSILSVFLIAGLGLAVGLFYKLRSTNVIKVRQRTKELEEEFSSALFQLGNRLGDGIPAEIALAKVSATMSGTTSGDFFHIAERNIAKLGMGLDEALFNPKIGAVSQFPSKVIESSMKVLVESVKKGPRIAAQALLSMANYIKEIHRVEERLKDLMSDVISSMKAQVKFLTPAIAGIVIGITSMISTILTKLAAKLGDFGDGASTGGVGGDMLAIFGIGMPTFHFQIVVGIYIIQLAYILTVLSNGVENGADKLGERYALGKNVVSSVLLYSVLAAVVMLLFNLFASSFLGNSI
ncbi:hypothetical protein HOD05_01510 [Candidatus Woesearchaeota archaeon]|jgi:Flp pilus assembly protein TadB|nr:hypothetical protein [Candidatus Woesearchaeota archaeon]MBT4151082.1 hypothetical protein [Candidatus Woesearchaeota archaeon]MBT4247034.1 hypothetical protein [Candidatus Woesearchaeota archaeon]MBT4433872.1 hypothetical protein [Candidatus Woesearchaeota archaeon]MBT7332129.1 hypothetical protein [Candidatus Woesearchaeota archaeon]